MASFSGGCGIPEGHNAGLLSKLWGPATGRTRRAQAEIEIGILERQCLGKRRIPSLKILRAEARAWNRRMNRDRVKIAWKFERKAARKKFGYIRKSFKRPKTRY